MNRREAYNALLRSDFSFFLRAVFGTLNPGEIFKDNWHIDAMCHSLSRVRQGHSKRLLITIPPRHLKSITVSVAFPAWVLGRDPTQKFLVSSYGSDLAVKFSRDFKLIIESTWYRAAFPSLGVPHRSSDGEITTRQGGGRKAVSVGGATTGFGADYIIVDDLMKAADATSPALRDAAIDYYRGSLISRLNDQDNGRIIVIAQRLHEADVPGHCMETGLFDHLNLPAIAQLPEQIPLGSGEFHVRAAGDLLFPQQQSRGVLDQLRIELGPTVFSAQYLQDPTPADSNLIRWHDIQRYGDAPDRRKFEAVVQSWDTAESSSVQADYSVCTTWGFYEGRWWLLDLIRFRAAFRELVDQARAHRNRWKPERILIEKAGSGRHLLEEFTHEHRTRSGRDGLGWKLVPCTPANSKIDRWAAQAAKLEAGQALLPEEAPWLELLRREMTGFPNSRHDDQVDSISQFLAWTSLGRTSVNLARDYIRRP